MAVDEFEIKQVIENRNLDKGNSSRSLVFKISKRTNKASKQQGLTACHKVTSNHSILRKEQEVSGPLNSILCLSSKPNRDDNISIKNLNKTGAAGDTIDAARPIRCDIPRSVGPVTVNVDPVMRRTSKRIYLRVRKPNFEVSDKTSVGQKIKDPSSETAKQGPSYGKMGRRRGGRKTPSAAVKPKSEVVRRGPGRPRTVNRDQPVEQMGKIVSTKSSKTPKMVVANHADNSSVWTLVPKEFANSDYFKSHIMKMHQRNPRGRRPRRILSRSHVPEIPQISFSSRKNIKVQFPKMPPVTPKSTVQQHPVPLPAASSRPTVIYFKAPNNGLGEMGKNPPVSNQINSPDHQKIEAVSSEELQFSSYPRQNYGNVVNDAALGYFYGFSPKNMKRENHLIRDAMFGRKRLTADYCTYSNEQYHLQSHLPMCQENKVGPSNEFVLQSNECDRVSESSPEEFSSYISCRQVIADSIRILYDDESVLGYA